MRIYAKTSAFKTRLSSFIKYRFYGISDVIQFPKLFNVFTFSWSKKDPSKSMKNNSSLMQERQTSNSRENVSYYLMVTNSIRVVNFSFFYKFYVKLVHFSEQILLVFKQSVGDGFIYLRGLFIIFFVDALIADDEPL